MSDVNAIDLPLGAWASSGEESIGLVCNELWGGNRGFHGPIELPGIRGALFSQPCMSARGGDVHYLSVCGSGLLSRVCLADVSGHGESVASVGKVMHDLLRRSVNRIDGRKVLRRMNLRLCNLNDISFTTAAALTYFPPTARLSISYAGHEPAWYWTASRQEWSTIEQPERKGLFDIALAVEPKTRYTRCRRRVTAGDRLMMFTDGVLEAPNKAGELFGRARLMSAADTARDLPPEKQVRSIIKKLREHMDDAPLHHDDVSLLMIEFVDNLRSSALRTMIRNRLFGRRRGAESAEARTNPGRGQRKTTDAGSRGATQPS